MKLCDVPADFELDLGYRTVPIKAGQRHYPDELANAYPMSDYVIPDPDNPEPAPETPPADPPATDQSTPTS